MPETNSKLHSVRPGERTLRLEIPVVLPGVESADDACIARLSGRLSAQSGVSSAHVQNDGDGPKLCLHYDPNLMPLQKLERLVKDEGVQITQRFRHETFPLKGMAQGTRVANIEDAIRTVPGVLSVSVNYAVEKMWVEYDSTLGTRDDIAKATRALGYQVGESVTLQSHVAASHQAPLAALTPHAAPITPAHRDNQGEADSHADHQHDHDEATLA
ncbi:MAG: heavy-metal-associated domain-containing protein [Alphaproteobacteria bacterium]|nr:MAG: heavy-metal-associated domain-containing protein [Alphaproteobacteria bacterium]